MMPMPKIKEAKRCIPPTSNHKSIPKVNKRAPKTSMMTLPANDLFPMNPYKESRRYKAPMTIISIDNVSKYLVKSPNPETGRRMSPNVIRMPPLNPRFPTNVFSLKAPATTKAAPPTSKEIESNQAII